ncbi:Bug family tripartite tricarboxylate transporter substrate binding protein [Zestomonas carbonaria]|uniref:Tripartite tricarboxylate transporter substrate binding protein n=1 Tax=Zestomonas carbonaria TaxID=2762745 RepID=A0A7U7IAL8_9GAMM|nr:tripartite tricarboxylate transporter substrate binding protein [Pseudomonas carbonaria]CAD5109510.1 hypothetical protein PSEWESI4_03815 [Pseudomonas carbonaria]
MSPKSFIRRLLGLATLSASLVVGAAEWPSQPLKIVVPYPPGGAADTVARIYADALGESLGQTVLVDNRPGAGTAIAAEFVANSPADGYTLSLVPTGQLTVLPHIVKNLKFDPVKSFAPVSLLAYTGVVIAASDKVPAKNLPELVALAKSKPGELSYSSSGSGTIIHLAGEYFRLTSGTDLLHVPFKGSAPAVSAVLGGNVDLAVDTLTILAPQIQGGKLRGLAIASHERSPLLPDVPTVAESGYPDFEVTSWFGLNVPAATPAPIIQRLNAEIARAAASSAVKEKLATQGLVAWPSTPEAFAEQIRSDSAKYGEVVAKSHITFD